MKLSFFSFVMIGLLFLGTGCVKGNSTTPSSSEVIPSDETELSEAPVITLIEEGKLHSGVEGSYCYQGMCVDKIAPPDLIGDSPDTYQTMTGTVFTINLEIAATSLSADVLSYTATPVCGLNPVMISEKEYSAKLCPLEPGKYILSVGEQMDGGDVIYYFPINVDRPSK